MELSAASEELVFRGSEFTVRMEVDQGLLLVQISDAATADQWRGEFDAAYIEDLSRKTGNFKQFPIFCSMLESAVRKTSDSVTLDLLTYADLELLRNRKAGVVGRPRGPPQSSALTAKRYLILIYTVEFDRIHYPLPLPYVGKPDPAALQKEIRGLREQLASLTTRGFNKSAEAEIHRLRAELAQVKQEKDQLAKVVERLQSSKAAAGSDDWRSRELVRSLEEQLVQERVKGQRSAGKRCQEQRLLTEQLEELKESEASLRVRVKSLTNELALLRRGRATPAREREVYRSLSRDRAAYDTSRGRSCSRDRAENRRADSSGPRPCRPSPSPTGSHGRFDPTSFVLDRQRRQREAELKKLRKVRRDMLSSPVLTERGRSRSRDAFPQTTSRGRSLSIERRGSRNSSGSSVVDDVSRAVLRGRQSTFNGASLSRSGHMTRNPVSSTPTQRLRVKDVCVDNSELSEIDARLQALQDYMRDLDTGR